MENVKLFYIHKDPSYGPSYSEMQVYQQLDTAHSASTCSVDEHCRTAAGQNLSNFSHYWPGCGFFIFAVHSTCPAAELNLLIYNSKERFPLETETHLKQWVTSIIFILQTKQVIT